MSATGYKEKLGGKLHDECKGGVYYWATKGYFYFLKEVNNWSLGVLPNQVPVPERNRLSCLCTYNQILTWRSGSYHGSNLCKMEANENH